MIDSNFAKVLTISVEQAVSIEADVINYPLKGGSRTITVWFQDESITDT